MTGRLRYTVNIISLCEYAPSPLVHADVLDRPSTASKNTITNTTRFRLDHGHRPVGALLPYLPPIMQKLSVATASMPEPAPGGALPGASLQASQDGRPGSRANPQEIARACGRI